MVAPKVGAQRSRAWIPHPGLRQELSLRISGRLVNGIAYMSCVCAMATIRNKHNWAKMWVLIAWKTGVISWNALTQVTCWKIACQRCIRVTQGRLDWKQWKLV